MKKLITLLSIVVLTSGALSSCVPDEATPDETKNQIEILSADGTYLGTENKRASYKIDFKTADANFEFQLISDAVADSEILDATIKSNKYTVSDSGELYTTKVTLTKEGHTSKIISGDFDITQTGNNFTIKGDFIDEQNVLYHVNYVTTIDIQPLYDTVYEIQNGWFWGDNEFDYPNIGEYMSFFSQGDVDKYGELQEDGTGYYISLSFFDNMPEKAWEAQIPNKTFKASNTIEKGFFRVIKKEDIVPGNLDYTYALFMHYDSKEGFKKQLYVIDGTVKTIANSKGQELRFNVELEDGSRHIGKYVGKVRQGDEYTISTLKEDRTVGSLDYGYLEYDGKSPIAGKENNRWNIYIYNQGITTYPEYYWATEGSGEFMRVTIYTDVNATTDIPVGEYPIGEEKAGNAGFGGGSEAGLDFGTWFFEMKNDDFINYAPTRTGKVIIAKVGNQYTINVNSVDDRNNKIVANYTGALTFYNSANKPSAKQKKNNKSYGKGKLYDATKKLKK